MSKSIIIDNQEYISINEFARVVEYSPQGIYKMINNPLNPLYSLVKKVKGNVLTSAVKCCIVQTVNKLNITKERRTK